MNDYIQKVSTAARQAAQAKNWTQVKSHARDILSRARDSAEGYFLLGLAESASNERERASKAFSRAIQLDDRRYDAAVEWAALHMRANQYGEAVELLGEHVAKMDNSPRYLDMAGTIYVNAGQPEKAWPLYRRANELQPGIHALMANYAACSVFVGKIEEAKEIYRECLAKFPQHQRHHYELSRLGTAKDLTHIEEMKAILSDDDSAPEKNIYLYYALGKELEDLERWDEAFDYFQKAGKAALSVSDYDVDVDVQLIDKMIEVCSPEWLTESPAQTMADDKTPVFVVGLPRTGTTLTERILSCHSMIESVGESYFVQVAIKDASRVVSREPMTSSIVEAAAGKDIQRIANSYTDAIAYRFGDKPLYIEKFPENFLYLGFIAKAFPNAKIVHLNRNPMDSCFAMFKQSFFRYAYSLDDLGPYFAAYHRLHNHWRELLGDRLIEVHYEDLVSHQEDTTRRLLAALNLDFEEACLHFEQNEKASNTASTVQIRQKIHTRSVNRWKCFEKQLQSLKVYLEDAGVPVSE